MQIVRVTAEHKDRLGKLISNNKADYFSYIREFNNNFSDSQFWLALDNN